MPRDRCSRCPNRARHASAESGQLSLVRHISERHCQYHCNSSDLLFAAERPRSGTFPCIFFDGFWIEIEHLTTVSDVLTMRSRRARNVRSTPRNRPLSQMLLSESASSARSDHCPLNSPLNNVTCTLCENIPQFRGTAWIPWSPSGS